MKHQSSPRRWPVRAGIRPALALLAALSVSASCSGRESERSVAAAGDGLEWRATQGDSGGLGVELDTLPSLRMPEVTPASDLFGYMPVLLFGDGRVGVTEHDAVRIYSPDGSEQAVGRRGGGPGEFRNLMEAGLLPGDSIWAFDIAGSRLTLFAPDGALLRTANFADVLGPSALVIGRMRNGRFLALERALPGPTPRASGSIDLDSTRVLIADTSGATSLGWFPLREWWVSPGAQGFITEVPFGPQGVFAVSDSTFLYGWGATDSVREIGLDGRVRRSFVVPVPARPVTPEDKARGMAEARARPRSDFSAPALELMEKMTWPESFPVFDGVLADDALLLVRAGRPRAESEVWYGFDRVSGPLLGTLRVPAGCSLVALRLARLAMLCEGDDENSLAVYGIRLRRTQR